MTDDRPEAGAALRVEPAGRWSGGRLRVIRGGLKLLLGASIAAVLLAGTVHTVRAWLLPEAPEPFDAAAFRAATVPDDRNAYTLIVEIKRSLDAKKESFAGLPGGRSVEWAAAKPEVRAWALKNRPELELWRQAAGRPDALFKPSGSLPDARDSYRPRMVFYQMTAAALLEAGRLEEAGEFGAAWDWHNARLRANLLMGRRGTFLDRWSATLWLGEAAARAQVWAEQKSVTVPMLRRALADVEATAALLPDDADTIRAEYLSVKMTLDNQAESLHEREEWLIQRRPGSDPANPDLAEIAARPLRRLRWWVGDYLAVEPERSRRASRLVFANWLAHAEGRPEGAGPPVSADPLVFGAAPGSGPTIGPGHLASLARSSPLWTIVRGQAPAYFPWQLDQWPRGLQTERNILSTLYVGLASRIYEIETGKVSNGPEQLVPSVLPGLPGFYLAPEFDD